VTQERGPWSVHEDDGSIQPAVRRADDIQGCSGSSHEEGNLRPRRPAAAGAEREGPSLGATRPAQSSAVFQRPSPQTVVGSRRRPQAAFRSGSGFRGLALRRACSAVGLASEGLSWLAAFVILLREGKGRVPSKARSKRAQVRRSLRQCSRGAERNARIGCSGVCPCVGKSVAEVVGRQPRSREAPVDASREQREAGRWAGTGI